MITDSMTTEKARGKKLFVETPTESVAGHIISSELRPAEPEDVRAAWEAHQRGKCPHNVIWDEPGWMYDFRECATCGAGLGAI